MYAQELYIFNRNCIYSMIRKYTIFKHVCIFSGLLSFCFAVIPHHLFPILPGMLSFLWTCPKLNSSSRKRAENHTHYSWQGALGRCTMALIPPRLERESLLRSPRDCNLLSKATLPGQLPAIPGTPPQSFSAETLQHSAYPYRISSHSYDSSSKPLCSLCLIFWSSSYSKTINNG